MGIVIVLFSPQGGAGRTTIATNLAVALHQSSKKPVVLVDGSLPFGDIAVALNVSPKAKTAADLVVVGSFESITSEVLESVLVSDSTGIKVLLAPPTPESTELITGAHIKHVLELLRERYAYIVVDTWPSYQEQVIAMLDEADLILVPMTVEVPSLKNVLVFLEVAEGLGYPRPKVQLVANRFDPAEGITLGDAEASLGKQFLDVLASDRRPLVSAMNRGIPVVASYSSSAIARDILRLAEKLLVVAKTKHREDFVGLDADDEWRAAHTRAYAAMVRAVRRRLAEPEPLAKPKPPVDDRATSQPEDFIRPPAETDSLSAAPPGPPDVASARFQTPESPSARAARAEEIRLQRGSTPSTRTSSRVATPDAPRQQPSAAPPFDHRRSAPSVGEEGGLYLAQPRPRNDRLLRALEAGFVMGLNEMRYHAFMAEVRSSRHPILDKIRSSGLDHVDTFESRRHSEDFWRRVFVSSAIVALLGLALAAVGAAAGLLSGTWPVLWLGAGVLALGVIGAALAWLGGTGVAGADVEAALWERYSAEKSKRTQSAVEAEHDSVPPESGDIHEELPVATNVALLGGKVTVLTGKGRVLLRIPAQTQTGRVIRLSGQGTFRAGGERGDMYVTVRVASDPDVSMPTSTYQRSHWSWVLVVLFAWGAMGNCYSASQSGGIGFLYIVAVGFAFLTNWAWHRGDPSMTGWLSQRKLAIAGTLLIVVPYVVFAIGVAGLPRNPSP